MLLNMVRKQGRTVVPRLYDTTSAITGPLTDSDTVQYRKIFTKSDTATLRLFAVLVSLSTISIITLLAVSLGFNGGLVAIILVALAGIVELIRFIQSLTLLIFASKAKDPIPMKATGGRRIAVLTTIVPSKEPLELVAETLLKMKAIDPGEGNTIDVWLLDEGDDYDVKRRCAELGVYYFSRKSVAQWNMPSGPYKTKTKHGNHNSWRSVYENGYDVVAQMDPDHVPTSDFLTRTLGYFNDPDVAFVVAPQVYGNSQKNWIARASAFQAYIFHGIIQRGANGLNAPLLIGTNHLYRVGAFKHINGYQDSIIEDHLTSMVVYASSNKEGRNMKGVYTPDIIAVGEGPTSFTDYFNQQKRWAYGVWDIALKSSPGLITKMGKSQALSFAMLQFFYPSVAISWVLGSILTLLFCFAPLNLEGLAFPLALTWLISIASTIGLFLWLRKFNLVEHEKKDWGIQGMGLLLMTIPIYVNAAVQAIARRPLTYEVTAKGNLTSPDTIMTFASHINWVAFNVLSITLLLFVASAPSGSNAFWILERIAICLTPIALFMVTRYAGWFKKLFKKRIPLFARLRQAYATK